MDYVGLPRTANDMNNGKAAFPECHNVYIDPKSWATWKKVGHFRDGTIIVKALLSADSKSTFSGKGYFIGDCFDLIEAHPLKQNGACVTYTTSM